jgi:hypothetical protein
MEPNMSDAVQTLTVAGLRDVLQAAGYRAELISDSTTGVTLLRSAASGLSFDVRFGNQVPGETDGFTDATLVMYLRIVGDLPFALVNKWNNTHRFGRLQIDDRIPSQSFLVFCMDIVGIGGVTPTCLRAQIDIWDGLLQQLVAWLREELAPLRLAMALRRAWRPISRTTPPPTPLHRCATYRPEAANVLSCQT